MNILQRVLFTSFILPALFPLMSCAATGTEANVKITGISPDTPEPTRFVVRGASLLDLERQSPVFFRGIGYSPYLHRMKRPCRVLRRATMPVMKSILV